MSTGNFMLRLNFARLFLLDSPVRPNQGQYCGRWIYKAQLVVDEFTKLNWCYSFNQSRLKDCLALQYDLTLLYLLDNYATPLQLRTRAKIIFAMINSSCRPEHWCCRCLRQVESFILNVSKHYDILIPWMHWLRNTQGHSLRMTI